MSDPVIKQCGSCFKMTVIKMPTTFVSIKLTPPKEKKPGETTKEYIEENREILKQMQDDAKNVELK
tara:strand:- start:8030 stop:8227 length:198 start_codon:yes stop_codon:yes gene_type:complete